MKRLERLGSAAFLTVILSLVFHLIGMSYDRWVENICLNCNASVALGTWYTSLNKRCYQAPVVSIFLPANYSDPQVLKNAFITEICIPNEYLMAKKDAYAYNCLLQSLAYPDSVCSLGIYDKSICKCDYTQRTKIVMAMSVLAALSLGIMVFLSHLISFVKIDYILRWLIPGSFILLTFGIICIIVTLAVAGSNLSEEAKELLYSTSLVSKAFQNITLAEYWDEYLNGVLKGTFNIRIGWCFGMEIIALHFAVTSLVLYLLMFTAKQRPETFQ